MNGKIRNNYFRRNYNNFGLYSEINYGTLQFGKSEQAARSAIAAGIAARSPSDAKALSVSTHSVRKGGRESFALCDEGGAVAVFEPANQ